jgi:hypothetical protein
MTRWTRHAAMREVPIAMIYGDGMGLPVVEVIRFSNLIGNLFEHVQGAFPISLQQTFECPGTLVTDHTDA